MNLYNYIKENVKLENVSELKGDKKELALVRMVMKKLSNLFYRDYTFFLYKENLKERKSLYDKKFNLENVEDFSIVCKNYCEIIQQLLKKEFDIDSELISPFSDEFKHIDLLITTKGGNRYIVDPLSDLVEMQVGLRTNNFASEKYYNETYLGILDNISFLNDKELEDIDDKIKYKNGDMYLDDILEQLKVYFDNNFSSIGNDEMMTKKFEFLMDNIKNRNNIKGIVDLMMYLNIIIAKMFSKEERTKIEISTFFADKEDLVDEDLNEILESKSNRSRGIEVKINDKVYVISINSKYLEYEVQQWEDKVKKNKIFIRPKYPVKLLGYLKRNGADRNIVHNNEFLRLFNLFENYMDNNGETLDDIKNKNLTIRNGMIFTRFGEHRILYRIEDYNLVVEDYGKNIRNIIIYQDEGRDISYRREHIIESTSQIEKNDFERE